MSAFLKSRINSNGGINVFNVFCLNNLQKTKTNCDLLIYGFSVLRA